MGVQIVDLRGQRKGGTGNRGPPPVKEQGGRVHRCPGSHEPCGMITGDAPRSQPRRPGPDPQRVDQQSGGHIHGILGHGESPEGEGGDIVITHGVSVAPGQVRRCSYPDMGAVRSRLRLFRRFVIFQQDARCITLQVVILIVAQCPDKGDKRAEAKQKRTGNENHENVHGEALVLRALRVTVIELVDMASAAIKGVANPASASGMAIML